MSGEPKVRAWLTSAPCGVALLDERGVVREASGELARMLGLVRVDDLIGGSFARLVRDEGEGFVRWCDALLRGGACAPIERRLAGPEGRDLPARLTGSRLAIDDAHAALVFVNALRPAALGVDEPMSVVLDRIHDAVIAYDRDWRYVYVNRSAEQHLGIPRELLLGMGLWEVFPQLLGTELEASLRRAATGEGPIEFELRGPVRHRDLVVRAYPSAGGLVCYYRDVTEQREAEAALRASEEKYRLVFENSLDAMFLTKVSGEILAANPAACRVLGRTEEEIRAGGREGVVDVTDPRLPALLAERTRMGKVRGELRIRRKDGTMFPAEMSSAVFSGAEGVGFTSMSIVDLSERERGQRALEFLAEASAALSASLDYEETLRALTRLVVPRGADVCVVDLVEGDHVRRAAVAHASPEAESLLARVRAFAPDHETETGVMSVLRTGDAVLKPELDDAWQRADPRDEAHGATAPPLKPRSLIMVPMSVGARHVGVLSLVRGEAGPAYDAFDLSVAMRLAEHAALAIENARHYRAAVEAKRLRDEMLGIVSHDLRSPLNAIALSAMVIGRRCAEQAPMTERITRTVKYANRLIEDLLLIARVDEGQLTLHRTRERVGSLLDEVVALHAQQAEASSIRLEADAAQGAPDVLVDRHRIVRLLSNLVSNALKFTPEGGTVSLGARADDGRVILAVSDTGHGIRAEDMPRLFDRFWQGAHARRADAGLGLAIVKGIAEAHGGAVTVRSEVGRGTTFEVSLPAMSPR